VQNKNVPLARLMSLVVLCALTGVVSAQTIRVDVGGSTYTDSASNVWSADSGFNTGTQVSWGNVAITGTSDPTLYRAERWDPPAAPEMNYSFNVPNGTYTVRLHFCENYSPLFGVGLRIFDVTIQGALVYDNLDVFAQAGARTVLIKTSTATVTNGTLTIGFVHQTADDPFIDAIEIIPTTDTTAPSAPGSLTATAAGSAQINLSWGAAADNVGVTGYLIERCQGAGCSNFAQINTATGTTYNDGGLGAQGAYSYRVRARDAANNLGGYSNTASATTGVPTATVVEYRYDEAGRLRGTIAPAVEASYTLDAAGNRTAVTSATGRGLPGFVSVTPPTTFTGSYTVSWGNSTGTGNRFELFEATNPGFAPEASILLTAAGSPQRSLDISAKPNGTYYYRMRVCDAAGTPCGPRLPAPAPVVVQPPPAPGVPGTLTITSPDLDGTYDISWIASNGAITGISLTYQLYEATASNFSNETQVYTGTDPTKHFIGQANGTYYYRVRACNLASCSALQPGANPMVVTLTPGTPGRPTFVPAVSYINVGTYTVGWTAPSGVPVTSYQLLENIAFGSESQIYSGATPSFGVSGRGNGTYSYRLRACNAGCSAYTDTQGSGPVIMVDTLAPTPPGQLQRTGQTFLNWSNGSTDTGGGGGNTGSGVDRWRVYRNGTLIATVLSPTVAYNDTAAPSNQTHTWTVRSVDRAGNESATAASLTAFVDTLPPSAPTGVTATGVSSTTINVAWNASVDPNGGTVSGYFVYRNGVNQQWVTGTSLSDIGLAASTTYTYTVAASDNAGNVGPLSTPVNGTTTANIPSVPDKPASIGVSFPPGHGGSPSYTVFWSNPGPPTHHYILYENGTLYNTGSTNSKAFNKTSSGSFLYKAKACTAADVCGQWSDDLNYDVCVGSCN
jgi:chitodextrinase